LRARPAKVAQQSQRMVEIRHFDLFYRLGALILFVMTNCHAGLICSQRNGFLLKPLIQHNMEKDNVYHQQQSKTF
jgi:hypothetical protein